MPLPFRYSRIVGFMFDILCLISKIWQFYSALPTLHICKEKLIKSTVFMNYILAEVYVTTYNLQRIYTK